MNIRDSKVLIVESISGLSKSVVILVAILIYSNTIDETRLLSRL